MLLIHLLRVIIVHVLVSTVYLHDDLLDYTIHILLLLTEHS